MSLLDILLFLFINSILAVIMFSKTDVTLLIAGKAVKGFALGVLSSAIPVYVGEVFTEESSEKLVSYFQCCVPAGLLISSAVAYFGSTAPFALFKSENQSHNIRSSWALAFVPASMSFFMSIFIRESPTDMFIMGHSTTSLELLEIHSSHLRKIMSEPQFKEYINDRHNQIMRQTHSGVTEKAASTGQARVVRKTSVMELFKACFSSKDVLTAILTQCAVQLSGINAFMYYFTEICVMSEMSQGAILPLTLGLNGINVLANFITSLYATRVSRVMNIFYGFLIMGLCHILLFLALQSKKSNISTEASQADVSGILAVTYCFIAVATFSITIAIQSMLYTVELVPSHLAEIGLPVAVACGWFTNFVLTCTLPTAFNVMSAYVFTFFAMFCFCLYATFFHLKDTLEPCVGERPLTEEGKRIIDSSGNTGDYAAEKMEDAGYSGAGDSTRPGSRFSMPRLAMSGSTEKSSLKDEAASNHSAGRNSGLSQVTQSEDFASFFFGGSNAESQDSRLNSEKRISDKYLTDAGKDIDITAFSPLGHLSKAVLRKPSGGYNQSRSTAGSFKSTSVGSMINKSFEDGDINE